MPIIHQTNSKVERIHRQCKSLDR